MSSTTPYFAVLAIIFGQDCRSETDNKLFWKVIKPTFLDKAVSNVNTALVENEEIISDENRICEFSRIFKNFFSNTESNLNIPETEHSSKIIERIDKNPSIMKIKNIVPRDQTFSLQHVNKEEIQKRNIKFRPY